MDFSYILFVFFFFFFVRSLFINLIVADFSAFILKLFSSNFFLFSNIIWPLEKNQRMEFGPNYSDEIPERHLKHTSNAHMLVDGLGTEL